LSIVHCSLLYVRGIGTQINYFPYHQENNIITSTVTFVQIYYMNTIQLALFWIYFSIHFVYVIILPSRKKKETIIYTQYELFKYKVPHKLAEIAHNIYDSMIFISFEFQIV